MTEKEFSIVAILNVLSMLSASLGIFAIWLSVSVGAMMIIVGIVGSFATFQYTLNKVTWKR